MRKRTHKRLTLEQAERALYIDFEGRKDHPPVLLGATRYRSAERVHQYVTDPRYIPVGSRDELEVLTFPEAVERIFQRAEAHDRLIVAWTTHELDLVERWAPELLERFKARFQNALTVAKYWRNARHVGERAAYGSLANYMDLIKYEVPERAGRDRTAETIRRIDRSIRRDPSGRFVTRDQWIRWNDVRDHNAHDCAGMRAVCIRAAADIAAAAA